MRVVAVALMGLDLLLASARAEPGGMAEKGVAVQQPPVQEEKASRPSADTICRTIERAAAENALPVVFFARLIWQESRFDPRAVSRAGAQGIAQFMPGTALWRGLVDPFRPLEALKESAVWLGELRRQYGNLGLAAAAYNAGPRRVETWLAGRGGLPAETRAYVRIITGRSADEWAAPEPPDWEAAVPKGLPCTRLANLILPSSEGPARDRPKAAPPPLWGVQLAGDWSEARALANFRTLQLRYSILNGREPVAVRVRFGRRAHRTLVRVGEATREAANRLCTQLRRAGGACAVLRNPTRPIADSVAGS